MARQIAVIDLTENDGSHQDKVNKLEATVASLEKRLDSLTELVVTLMDACNPVRNVSNPGPSAPVAPIYTVAPPTMQVAPAFECDAQQFPNLHAFLLEKEFGGFSSKISNEKSNGEGLPNAKENNGTMADGKALPSQAGLGEVEKENVFLDMAYPPVYDGIGNPHDHLKAFTDWVAIFGKSNGIKLRLFVKTLAGPALTWLAIQDLGKRFTWDDLARNFVKQYELPNLTFARSGPLKRKSVELQEESFAIISDKRKCELVEAQPKDKGKAVMSKPLPAIAGEPSANAQVIVNPSSPSNHGKRSAFAFTRLPESYARLFERLKEFNLVHPIEPKSCRSLKPENFGKFCVYHSGMHGHYIGECITFKEKVESLINSGQVKVLPTNGTGKPFVAILPYAKGDSSKKGI